MRKLLAILFVLTLTACMRNPKPPTEATAEPTEKVAEATALCAAQATAEPATCVQPTATALPATAEPTATCTCTCPEIDFQVDAEAFGQIPDDPIYNNMDVGDGTLTSIVFAWDRKDLATTFIAIIEPGLNLDFENATISGEFWQTSADSSAVICWANQLWKDRGASAYRLYVSGAHQPPYGWSKDFPENWKMKIWAYDEAEIKVPGAQWDPTLYSVNSERTFGSASWTYGQLWNGVNAKIVYHFIVVPNYEMATPKYQGTVWTISGITHSNLELLYMRFIQATGEVLKRDDDPKVHQYFCGPEEYRLSGWIYPPNGWTCTKKT